MSNLVPSVGGPPSPFTAAGRAVLRQSRGIRAEVQLAGLKIQGIEAVTELSFECLADLDAKRRAEAGADPVVNQLCAELELIAARRIGRVVNGLYSEWRW